MDEIHKEIEDRALAQIKFGPALKDNRKIDRNGNAKPETLEQYDDFRPTLAGFMPLFDSVLLRELKLPDESAIVTPDAFAEPCLCCEVIAVGWDNKLLMTEGGRTIVRILKGIGTTIAFSDTEPKQRYFTVHAQDIIGLWRIA